MKYSIGNILWGFALFILVFSIFFKKKLPESIQNYWWIILTVTLLMVVTREILKKNEK
ncbi:MAG: hypothetical protein RL222_461 [Bacteroidota bacterium]|jgi:hypothetical protein